MKRPSQTSDLYSSINYLPLNVCLLILIGLNGQACRADTVTLTDGTVHEGKILSEDKDSVTFQMRMGNLNGSIVIPRSEIAAMERKELPPDPVVAAGQELKKSAEAETDPVKAVRAWLRLGEFYEQNPGFSASARASFQKVLLFDPDQPIARAKLGYVKTENGWRKAGLKKPEEPLEIEIVKAPERATDEDALLISLRADAEAIRRALEEQARRLNPPPARFVSNDISFVDNDVPYQPYFGWGYWPFFYGWGGGGWHHHGRH